MKKGQSVLAAFVVIGILVVIAVVFIESNWGARTLGGHMKINPLPGYKLVNMSWKETQLWVLFENDKEFLYREYSNLGILEGSVSCPKPQAEQAPK